MNLKLWHFKLCEKFVGGDKVFLKEIWLEV